MANFAVRQLLPLLYLEALPANVDGTPGILQFAVQASVDHTSQVLFTTFGIHPWRQDALALATAELHLLRVRAVDDPRNEQVLAQYAGALEALFSETGRCDWYALRPESLGFKATIGGTVRTHDSMLGEYTVVMMALVALLMPKVLLPVPMTAEDTKDANSTSPVPDGDDGEDTQVRILRIRLSGRPFLSLLP